MTLKVRHMESTAQLPALPTGPAQGRVWLKNAETRQLARGPAGDEAIETGYLFIEIGKTIVDRYKELLAESPGAVDRHELVDGASVRELHGTGTKIRAAIGDELSDEEFLDACKTSFAQLEAAFMEAQDLDKAGAAFKVNRLLEEAGLITIRSNAPSLKRI